MIEKSVLKGAKEIAEAGGFCWKQITTMVKDEGLPAFKRKGKGTWLAVPDDIAKWVKDQREKYLKVA